MKHSIIEFLRIVRSLKAPELTLVVNGKTSTNVCLLKQNLRSYHQIHAPFLTRTLQWGKDDMQHTKWRKTNTNYVYENVYSWRILLTWRRTSILVCSFRYSCLSASTATMHLKRNISMRMEEIFKCINGFTALYNYWYITIFLFIRNVNLLWRRNKTAKVI